MSRTLHKQTGHRNGPRLTPCWVPNYHFPPRQILTFGGFYIKTAVYTGNEMILQILKGSESSEVLHKPWPFERQITERDGAKEEGISAPHLTQYPRKNYSFIDNILVLKTLQTKCFLKDSPVEMETEWHTEIVSRREYEESTEPPRKDDCTFSCCGGQVGGKLWKMRDCYLLMARKNLYSYEWLII